LAISGVNIPVYADEHAPVGEFFSSKDCSAGPLHLVDGRPMCVLQLKWAGSGQRQLLPQRVKAPEFASKALQSEDRIGRRNWCAAAGWKLNRS
jgi:hypothetical protein